MIEKIWESGYMNSTGNEIGYMISMVWHEDSVEKRKDFEGTDITKVRDRAFNFMMLHYIDESKKLK